MAQSRVGLMQTETIFVCRDGGMRNALYRVLLLCRVCRVLTQKWSVRPRVGAF